MARPASNHLKMYRLVIAPAQQENSTVHLTPQQEHYLKRVLRLQAGDYFITLDGRGETWLTQLGEVNALLIEPLAETNELPLAVTLMVALPKGSGFEEIVRCCTELGVTTLVPLLSQRTLLHPSASKLERWRRIAQEAAEQSERQLIPTIIEPLPFSQALAQVKDPQTNCYICVTRRRAKSLLWYLQQQPPHPTVIMTGPEGGWTDQEVAEAIAGPFQPVSLGSRILRAVTAPVMALSLVAATLET